MGRDSDVKYVALTHGGRGFESRTGNVPAIDYLVTILWADACFRHSN